jgi:hypothetical protein
LSIRDRISKTSTFLLSPNIIVSPHCTINNVKYILTPSWEQGDKIHHTIHTDVILSIMSNVPDNTTTVLKNLAYVSERKLSMTGIQTDPLECDRFPVDIHTFERELVFVLQMSEASIQRNCLLQKTVDIG